MADSRTELTQSWLGQGLASSFQNLQHNQLNFYQQAEPSNKFVQKSKPITQRSSTERGHLQVNQYTQQADEGENDKSKIEESKLRSDSDEKYSIQSLSGAIRQKLFQDERHGTYGAETTPMQTQGSDLNLDSYVDVTQENIKTQRVIRLKKRNNKSVIQEKNLLSSRNQSEIIDSNTENNAYGNAIVTEP